MKYIFTLILTFLFVNVFCQNTEIHPDRVSYPKISTSSRANLPNLQAGQVVYDTDLKSLMLYDGTKWNKLVSENSNSFKIFKTGEPAYGSNDWLYCVNADGSIIVSGFFGTPTLIGNSLLTDYTQKIFMSKFDAFGNQLWTKQFGDWDEKQLGDMVLDNTGNIYLTGSFRTSFSANSVSLIGNSGDFDFFLAKFNEDGDCIWAVKDTSPNNFCRGLNLTIDNNNNPVVAGTFFGNSTFGSTTLSSGSSASGFLAKFTATGVFSWAKSLSFNNQSLVNSLSSDSNGNILLCGNYFGSITINGNTTISNGTDALLIKYDNAGNVLWGKTWGGVGAESNQLASFSSDGGIIVGGILNYSFNFQGKLFDLGSTNQFKLYLANLDFNGNLQWHKIDGLSSAYLLLTGIFEKNDNILLSLNTNQNLLIQGEIIPAVANIPVIAKYNYTTGLARGIVAKKLQNGHPKTMKLGNNNVPFLFGSYYVNLFHESQLLGSGVLNNYGSFIYTFDL